MIAKILLPLVLATLLTVPEAYAQSVGGSGSGGGGLRQNVTRAGHRGCKEGTRTLFYERDTIQDQTVAVYRTCQNGSYYDLTDYIYNPKSRCTEGRRELWQERDHVNDSNVYKRVVCTKGKWKVIDEFH